MITVPEERQVEEARALLARREAELHEHEKAAEELTGKLGKIDRMAKLKADDLVMAENLRRGLVHVAIDVSAATADVAAARDVLTAAEQVRDAAVVLATREEATRRRAALDEKVDAASRSGDPAEAVFELLDSDPRLERLRAEVRELQELVEPLGRDAAVAGPWAKIPTSPAAFFVALVDLAESVRKARERSEEARARLAEEEARRFPEPALIVDEEGRSQYVYTSEQAAKIDVPDAHLKLAREQPQRALALFDRKYLALLSAKDRDAKQSLRHAKAMGNAHGIVLPGQRPYGPPPQPADTEYDPLNPEA